MSDPSASTALAVPGNDLMTGLEDFGQSDMVLPVIRIDHKTGKFKDGLTGELMDELRCVILGLVKQRIMWDKDVTDDQPPLCRSLDFNIGRPNAKLFPFAKTPFTPGDETVACEACPMKEWGSHPTREVPWCQEQHTYVIALPNATESAFAPAIISFQSSGLKPSKAYLSGFARLQSPTFVAWTSIKLDILKRGNVDYAVPNFQKLGPTDESFYEDFARQYRLTRQFLHTPRVREEEEPVEGAAPPPQGTAARVVNDDEMPF